MKLKTISIIFLIAIAIGWNYLEDKRESGLSQLALENIEALASGEGSDGQTAPACKGDPYTYGAMKRVKGARNKCEFQNIINVTEDGVCWY